MFNIEQRGPGSVDLLVFESMPGNYLLLSPTLHILSASADYLQLTGKQRAELANRYLFDVFPETVSWAPEQNGGIAKSLQQVLTTKQTDVMPVIRFDLPADDLTLHERYWKTTNHPVINGDGELLYIIHQTDDATADILKEKKLEQAATEGRFRFLLNAMPQQVWTAKPDGALDYVNQVISEDFGHTADSVVGHGWKEFLHPDDLPGAVDKWLRALNSGRQYLTEFRLKFADGNYYWHLARALPLVEDGKITLWIGTNTNIHQQKTNEYQKDEFISIASHELKTPLTTIKAFFQLTKREAKEQKILSQFVDKAERQVERLGRLIEDLLDVSKINAGKMIYNMEDFNFGQALREVIESMQPTVVHKIVLQTECDITYRGDRNRLEQVLINLLNNAIKYSPNADQILVNATLEQQNVIVSVQDFGIGIAEEHLKDLFDRFYRVDNTSARFQGLGLGLFISAEIVKRHGGSFWIESELNVGSTFYYLLPLSGKQEFSDIATDGQTYYKGSFINIRYRPDGNYMDVDWLGYQNYDSVVKGCTIMLDLMKKNNCQKVLNDNTHVKGNWSEASDWGAETWFPAMAEAGLKKFAWIYSPSTFSRIAANKSLPSKYDVVQVAFFDSKSAALQWVIGS